MFEFEPDEYIFTKFAFFFKKRKRKKETELEHAVNLSDIKLRLAIFARAITGESIEIFEADREGGYKNNNFFLPTKYYEYQTQEENISFYLFRVLYLSIQKNLNLNWNDNQEHDLIESQTKAKECSDDVLKSLFDQFPITQKYHQKFVAHQQSKSSAKQPVDFTFIYGKWMRNSPEDTSKKQLKNFTDKVKEANQEQAKTIIKSKAVEEIISVQVDQKQLEDAVLQHQFEKVETAEEFGGNFRDMDGNDDLEDHSNALDDVKMKHTVRVDDTAHSVYQADFIENTTIAESSENEGEGHYISYDEWNYATRKYKEDFCKVYPKTQLTTDIPYYKKTLNDNRSTLVGLRKMLTTVNNKYQQQRRQTQGEEFDIDAITDLFIDVKTGHTPSEKIYLSKRKKEKDLSILISDGKPNDYDKYEGKYGINDVKQALRELNERQINSYALAIEAQAKYYLPQMFGQNHYQILTNPVELLQSLVKLYEKIKHQS